MCTVVGVYVDDLLVTGTEQSAVNEFFKDVVSHSSQDFGIVNKFLGLRIELNALSVYVLDQEPAIDLILRAFSMEWCSHTFGDECNMDTEDDTEYLPARAAKGDPSMNLFQSLVGSLLWTARCTRPDIFFAVHKATRRTPKPTLQDWKTAKPILRYLKMSKNLQLHLDGDEPASEDSQVEL